MKRRRFLLVGLLLTLATSCARGDTVAVGPEVSKRDESAGKSPEPPLDLPAQPPVVPMPEFKLRWSSHAEGDEWTRHLLQELPRLGTPLILENPRDSAEWCPNWRALDFAGRVHVLAFLISAMSQFESNHRPEMTYQEKFDDAQGNPVVSRGLLQISIESGRGYRCPLASAADLHDPFQNLSCGVRILSRSVVRDHCLADNEEGKHWGAARYWSIFRKEDRIRAMKAWLHGLRLCRVHSGKDPAPPEADGWEAPGSAIAEP